MTRIQEVASSVLFSLGLAMLAAGVLLAPEGRVWAGGISPCECFCDEDDQACIDACAQACSGCVREITCGRGALGYCWGQCHYNGCSCPVGAANSTGCPCVP
jgi:hypothetical protein